MHKKKILSPRIITVLLLLLLCIRTVDLDGIPSRKINKRITINYIILFVGICAFGAIIIVIIIITSRWSFKQNFFQEKNRHALFAADDCTKCTHTHTHMRFHISGSFIVYWLERYEKRQVDTNAYYKYRADFFFVTPLNREEIVWK